MASEIGKRARVRNSKRAARYAGASMEQRDKVEVEERSVRAVRVGNGANCSSIGSVIDTLFATAAIGGAIFAAVAAALAAEPVRVVGGGEEEGPEAKGPDPAASVSERSEKEGGP
jgi:hypothetical protein